MTEKKRVGRRRTASTSPSRNVQNRKKTAAKTKGYRGTGHATGRRPRYIVGVGASAGGLEALRALFSALHPVENLGIIVVQHLAPQHRSRMVELIAQITQLRVKAIESGEAVQAGTVYVTPPNADIEFAQGVLHLRKPGESIGPKPSINRFFQSLASDVQENAIGVVLSGTGSDGAKGIRAIKAAGGVTICQLPESAKYDGMPRAAKQTGAIDLELVPEEIAKQLQLFDEYAARDAAAEPPQRYLPAQDPYAMVLGVVQQISRVNFREYKQSTIRRRIERRMVATRCGSLHEYADYLRSHPEEPQALFQDILISVTSFFRDPQQYQELAAAVDERIAAKPENSVFRCWVVGCATGEEAYSLSMLIAESIEKRKLPLNVQIFATDIDDQAMLVARKGVYPKHALDDVPPALVAKYFDEQQETLKVKDFLRDQIVFARHDVTQDPPFLKLDLISCRNVLIYFGSKLQEQVFRTFHFALDARGVLFLGKSEAATVAGELFDGKGNKHSKVFVRTGKKSDLPLTYSRFELNRENILANEDRVSTSGLSTVNSLITSFAPDSALVDESFRVRHLYGRANRYLNLPRGEPSTNITKLVAGPVASELVSLLHKAEKSQVAVRGKKSHAVVADGEPQAIQLSVVPVSFEGHREYFVCFSPAAAPPPALRDEDWAGKHLPLPEQVRRLEHELLATREHLQTVLEEHETVNEELQALNEELQSSNEELQSTNEELETTNEELQSSNEELTTLNQEVNVRTSELLALSQRLQAIQNAIFYPLLVVDMKFRLVDYNPAARYLFRVTDSDKGHSLRGSGFPLEFTPFLDVVADCLQKKRDGKQQLSIGARRFEVRVQLFQNDRGEFTGAVVSFVDNTELVTALEETRAHRERLSSILENTPAFVSMKDASGAYTYANRRFADFVGLPADQILGRTDEEIFGDHAGAAIRDTDFEVFKTRRPIRVEENVPAPAGDHQWLSSKFPLVDDRRKVNAVCTVSLDITESVAYRRQLEIFKQAVSASNAGIALFEARGDEYFAGLVSLEFARKLGLPQEDLLGKELEDFVRILGGGALGGRQRELSRQIRAAASDSFNINLAERQGGEDWIELRTATLRPGGDDAEQYLLLTVFDMNERVQTQRMLQAQQDEVAKFSKLASLGEVAAGISHEINTPLNVITTKADTLRRLAEREKLDAEKVSRIAADIDGMVHSISQVISGLKSLSGLESERKTPHDVKELITEALRICDFRIRRSVVQLAVNAPDGPVAIECFPVQIVQVLINLINNAVDAISELRDRWIRLDLQVVDGRAVLTVSDSGKGIDPAIAEKIMTPFFTTKQNRSGTGLGLSISRNIALHHGGDLSLVGGAAHTTFRLEFPLLRQPEEAA